MRKHIWLNLLEDYEEIGNFLREKVRIQYHAKVRHKVIAEKERFLEKISKESSQNRVIGIIELDKQGNLAPNSTNQKEINDCPEELKR